MTTWLSRQLRLSMWWAWSPGLHIGEQLLHLFLTFLVVWGGGGGRREEEGGERRREERGGGRREEEGGERRREERGGGRRREGLKYSSSLSSS